MKKKNPIKQVVNDYQNHDKKEIWLDGVLYNFVYGFLGKIVNRPKYVTDLGKFIVFPVPTALGAFIGYKISPILINFLN